jgi:hypothetical protein
LPNLPSTLKSVLRKHKQPRRLRDFVRQTGADDSCVQPLHRRRSAGGKLDTATTGNRRERDAAKKELETLWRNFLNANIRYNDLVPVADLEVFGINPRDDVRTP